MKTVYQKLRSESGISLLYGIIAALVAAFASAVIVSAASSAFRQVYDDQEAQQDHLTLLSAAELAEEELEDLKLYAVTVETAVSDDTEADTSVDTEKYYLFASDKDVSYEMLPASRELEDSRTYYETGKAFSKEISDALRFILTYSDDYSASFTISLTSGDDSETAPETVEVNMIMKSTEAEFGRLCLTFTLEGCDETLYLKMVPLGTMQKGTDQTGDIMNSLIPGGQILKSGTVFTDLTEAFADCTGTKTGTGDESSAADRYISSVEICEWGQADISEVNQ